MQAARARTVGGACPGQAVLSQTDELLPLRGDADCQEGRRRKSLTATALAVAVAALAAGAAVHCWRGRSAPAGWHELRGTVELAGRPAVCAEPGEDCRSTGCCSVEGLTCYEKDQHFAGCRPNCTKGGLDPEATGEAANGPWTCGVPKMSCACQRRCQGNLSCPDFPEVEYIYLPDSEEDLNRLERLSIEYDKHLSCGRAALHKVAGVNAERWEQGDGGYERVRKYGEGLPEMQPDELIWTPTGMVPVGDSAPWWNKHHLTFAEVDDQGRSTWVAKGLAHHASCSLSHFVVWMDARERGLPAVIMAESDALLSDWWVPYVGGSPDEYDSVILALLEDAPTDWDVIYLDKGRLGVRGDKNPVTRLERECWGSPYDVYEWTGEGQAGATMYMVSDRFLSSVPQIIHDVGFDMVDGWLGDRCNPDKEGPVPGGQLRCYSVVAAEPPKPCERVCIAEGQAATCAKRLSYAASASHGPDACSSARASVAKLCPGCAACAASPDACGPPFPHENLSVAKPVRPKPRPVRAGRPADVAQLGQPISQMTEGASPVAASADSEVQGQEAAALRGLDDGKAEDDAAGEAASSSNEACKSTCKIDGDSATCESRLQYALESLYADRPDACAAAYRLVRKQCKGCMMCVPPPEKCGPPAGSAPAPPAPAPPATSPGCAKECNFEGVSAECGKRVLYAAAEGLGEDKSCKAAHKLVLEQCSVCKDCELEDVGCAT